MSDSPAPLLDHLHPSWAHTELPGVGHVPPLESPTATADGIIGP